MRSVFNYTEPKEHCMRQPPARAQLSRYKHRRSAMHRTTRMLEKSIARRATVKLAGLAVTLTMAGLMVATGTASAATTDGAPVVLPGNQWLGGKGASIC